MAVGQIPPWIRPADEADYLGRGLQIGASMAAQQAQEEYRNQQLQLEQAQQAIQNQRQAQQDAIQQALNQQIQARLEKQFQIEAKQAAEKSQALLGYQQDIQGGADPLQAILKYGPAMGQQVSSVAQAQRALLAAQQRQKNIVPPEIRYANFNGQQVPFLYDKMTGKGTWMPSGYMSGKGKTDHFADQQQLIGIRGDIARTEALQKDWLSKGKPTELDPRGKDNALTKQQVKQYKDLENKLADLHKKEMDIIAGARKGDQTTGDETAPETTTLDDKKARARELRDEHPDWDKQDIIDQVNTEFSQEFSDATE